MEISVIMLTFNEERHIKRALNNSFKFAREVFVIDCYSTDNTVEIARSMGAKVYLHPFETHAKQFQWGLNNLPITTEWIWKQDADEYLTDALIEEMKEVLSHNPQGVNGYTAQCLRKFMGREIKHGIIPLILLRLFKYKCASIEDKMMDEHIQLSEGRIGAFKYPFYDDSLMTLTEWTQKHNNYATREAIDLLCTEYSIGKENGISNSGAHSASIRAKKLKYVKLPLFWRAFAFFIYRYIFRLGFIDGKEGFLWHFLQGFWYRALADAKVYEIKKNCRFKKENIIKYIHDYQSANNIGGG